MSGTKAITKVISAFLNGETSGKSANMYISGDNLYSYATLIAVRHGNTILLNNHKYSATTSVQQRTIQRLAEERGFKIELPPFK